MNLKKETLKVLEANGKTKEDIIAVQGKRFAIPVEDFWKLADVEYDSGYGSQKVATDLMLIGDGFWLERAEYDGSEWWDFRTRPELKPIVNGIKAITVNQTKGGIGAWCSLAELNEMEEE